MWEYKTVTFKIETGSKLTFDDKMNEYGKDDWEAYSVEDRPYYDHRLQIGKYKIQTATKYEVRLKKQNK